MMIIINEANLQICLARLGQTPHLHSLRNTHNLPLFILFLQKGVKGETVTSACDVKGEDVWDKEASKGGINKIGCMKIS